MNIKWSGVNQMRLRHAWADGVPLAVIARDLHCSVPAIVAQAARMELPGRNNRRAGRITTDAEHASAKALALITIGRICFCPAAKRPS